MKDQDVNIELENVRTHNLKDVQARFPLGKLSVVTGVSGSGKSSLVFDTLYAESYRRYVESLSSFARQYLKSLPKPELSSVRNLPPAIAVKQSRSGGNSRSTVGTMTELNDLLRILFAHLSQIICFRCHIPVIKESPESLAHRCLQVFASQRVFSLAPLSLWKDVKPKDLLAQLTAQGFSRILLGTEKLRLEDLQPEQIHKAEVIVDRVQVAPENLSRLAQAAGLALRLGRGRAAFATEAGEMIAGSVHLICPKCNEEYIEPSPSLLSFNHPLGACELCEGFGMVPDIDWEKVIPDSSKSMADEPIAAWAFGDHGDYYYAAAKKSAKKNAIDWQKPIGRYTKAEMEWLKKGEGKAFDGIVGYFAWLDEKRYKPHYRIHSARFKKYVVCFSCGGQRLNPKALSCRIDGENIAEVSRRKLSDMDVWLEGQQKQAQVKKAATMLKAGMMGLEEAFAEAIMRVHYLKKIGLGYLTIDRKTRTLSGGEQQRINMARSLGSALTDTLFCLDEPTCGLHARDSKNLLEIMYEMRDQGNTLVVVEHERTIIRGADHLIEVGPKAGHEGGMITFAGTATKKNNAERAVPEMAKALLEGSAEFLELRGVSTHNLQHVSVKIPLGKLTVVCGVSGSGKTSLVQHTLFPMLAAALGSDERNEDTQYVAESLGPERLLKKLGGVNLVSQGALGRSTRSNIATYLGFFDAVRKVLASTPEAQAADLLPGAFSFNTPGGRCENCRGLGRVLEDLSFLGEMEVLCPVCEGRRFSEEVLGVHYKGKNLLEILALTVAEARAFFHDNAAIVKSLDALIRMGLGYVTLGQNTSSFSGGEAQRLKLTSLIQETPKDRTQFLIFDEPTTGLSDKDVENFLKQLYHLTSLGHTLVVVEHQLDMIRAADWVIEIGPEAADQGGRVIYQGPPAGLKQVAESRTGPFLEF